MWQKLSVFSHKSAQRNVEIWMVYSHLPDEWKYETIGIEMTVMF